jgi:diguanylate cyclase (GGDEF)-like protein
MWSAPREETEGPLDVDRSPLALALVHRLLEIDSIDGVRSAIVEGAELLASAGFVRLWERADDAFTETARGGTEPGPEGIALEELLLPRDQCERSRSSFELHDDPRLARLSRSYREQGRLCHVRPVRTFAEGDRLVGAIAIHCFDRPALSPAELDVLRRYPDSAGAALRNAHLREELRRLAYTDPLTGLANRRAIEDRLAEHERGPRSVLFIDFDGLKSVNEKVSYEAGDAVIRAVGEALRLSESPDWLPGRLGGDEFVVFLPGTGVEGVRTEALALAARLEELSVPEAATPHFRGASVGWASAGPSERNDALLRRAASEMRTIKARRVRDRTP